MTYYDNKMLDLYNSGFSLLDAEKRWEVLNKLSLMKEFAREFGLSEFDLTDSYHSAKISFQLCSPFKRGLKQEYSILYDADLPRWTTEVRFSTPGFPDDAKAFGVETYTSAIQAFVPDDIEIHNSFGSEEEEPVEWRLSLVREPTLADTTAVFHEQIDYLCTQASEITRKIEVAFFELFNADFVSAHTRNEGHILDLSADYELVVDGNRGEMTCVTELGVSEIAIVRTTEEGELRHYVIQEDYLDIFADTVQKVVYRFEDTINGGYNILALANNSYSIRCVGALRRAGSTDQHMLFLSEERGALPKKEYKILITNDPDDYIRYYQIENTGDSCDMHLMLEFSTGGEWCGGTERVYLTKTLQVYVDQFFGICVAVPFVLNALE